jgi:hypothetical protein
LGADHLDGANQRVGQQERPPEAVPELGTRLRIGGDAAGIVVATFSLAGSPSSLTMHTLKQRRSANPVLGGIRLFATVGWPMPSASAGAFLPNSAVEK